MYVEEYEIVIWPEKRAKGIFRRLKRRGFHVDLGRTTGNIYSPAGQKLTWMLKDCDNNWCVELLFKPINHNSNNETR